MSYRGNEKLNDGGIISPKSRTSQSMAKDIKSFDTKQKKNPLAGAEPFYRKAAETKRDLVNKDSSAVRYAALQKKLGKK